MSWGAARAAPKKLCSRARRTRRSPPTPWGSTQSLEMTGAVMTLPRQTLRSTAYDLADALDVNELYQQKGWTDGLPIVPPTEERVLACLQAAGLACGDIVGVERVR